MDTDRNPSIGALLLALLAIGLLAFAAVAPWWSYDSSTGRKTAQGGPQDPSDTRVERHSLDYAPYQQRGDAKPSDEGGAKLGILVLGVLASAAGFGLLVVLVGEVWMMAARFPRAVTLCGGVLAVLALLAALAWTWLALPATMAGHGVQGAFTDRLMPDEYIRTGLGAGWVLAAIAVPCTLGAVAFRFQAGSHDASAVEAYA